MRLLIVLGILAFSVVSASAQTPATGKKKDQATCMALVQKDGRFSTVKQGVTPQFRAAVARCMKGQPI